MFKRLDTKLRLLISIVGSLIIYAFTPDWLQLATRIIIAWNAGVICFLVLVWMMISRATPQKIRLCGQGKDESRWIILIIVVIASCTSLLAIIFMLNGSKHLAERIVIFHIVLALFTIAASWLLIHTMFALHYAHLYYSIGHKLNSMAESYSHDEKFAYGFDSQPLRLNPSQKAALEFPSEKLPDYGDFLYFSFGIGMTFQVADVQITSRLLRRLALVHQVLSFFFNTLILALGVNILASFI